mgnify:FL=1
MVWSAQTEVIWIAPKPKKHKWVSSIEIVATKIVDSGYIKEKKYSDNFDLDCNISV